MNDERDIRAARAVPRLGALRAGRRHGEAHGAHRGGAPGGGAAAAGRTAPSLFRYAAALPLAASLALGMFLGAKGTLDFMMPTAITGSLAQVDDMPDELGGVGEAAAYAEESRS